MAIKDNILFSVAIQLVTDSSINTDQPIAFLYGFTKLLSYSEAQLKLLFPEVQTDSLKEVREYISDNKLNINLIKSGLPRFFKYIDSLKNDPEYAKLYNSFLDFINRDSEDASALQLFTKAIDCTPIDFIALFNEENNITNIISVANSLEGGSKGVTSPKTDASTEKSEPKSTPSESKPRSAAKEPNPEKVASFFKSLSQTLDQDAPASNLGNPLPDDATLSQLSEYYKDVTAKIFDVVKGQDPAVIKFIQGCFQGDLLETVEDSGPMASFFFLGPPGTGKTLLAKTAAKVMGRKCEFFNMSEYVAPDSFGELVGTPTIYGNARQGKLTSFVMKHPKSIVIFDEIEKAHISVIRIFLQMLNSGKMKDVMSGKDVSFKDTIVIFTSNAGKKLYDDTSVNLTLLPEKVVISSIAGELPPEICSRIASGNMIMFNHIGLRYLADMVEDKFDAFAEQMKTSYDCSITYPKELPLFFLFNKGGELDARIANRKSSAFLEDEVYEITRQMDNSNESLDSIKSIQFEIDWEGCPEDIRDLFVNKSKSEVIVMAEDDVVELFDVDPDKYIVHVAKSIEEAKELLKKEISAVFIAPYYMENGDNTKILSVSDYKSLGVDFFHYIAGKESGMPVYILDTDSDFSSVDNDTFIQEGAFDVIEVDMSHKDAFKQKFVQLMDVLYIEVAGSAFTQKGWIIDYSSKQDDINSDGMIKVTFYNLTKKKAVDASNRGSFVSDAERPDVKFDDIIGASSAKEELQYFIKYLSNPKQFLSNGGQAPKGVLLYGPPGTGKTMLAKAMAGESNVNFLEVSAANFLNKYVGGSEENVRQIFATARKYAPAILFIDEIDAIGKARTGSENTAATETVLNVLLTEMDGFNSSDKKRPVFVLAATNYGVSDQDNGISSLDEALIRRFDNKIKVDLPKENDRYTYLKMMTERRGITDVSDSTLKNVAERSVGLSLAILKNVLDLAFRNATKEGRSVVDNDLLKALEDYTYGELHNSSEEYYRSVAYHELGHAYVSYLAGDCPSYITIESRGNFGGYMQHSSGEDKHSYTREDLIWRIRTSLAGRASEYVFYDNKVGNNTGASQDLEHATQLALSIILKFGMQEGQFVVLDPNKVLQSSLADKYVTQANELLAHEFEETIKIIRDGKETIEQLTVELLKENKLTGAQFKEIMTKLGH